MWLILVLAVAALAQQGNQTKKQEPPPEKKDSLFKAPLGIRSSEKTKESATLGFNGIDPSGKVDQQMMATSPNDSDRAKVKSMTDQRPSPSDLSAFLNEGGLPKK
jgi:hypothetical protein